MKHQQVSVDYWAMGKAMLMYGFLTAMGWMLMRLFNTVFTLPRRMRAQQENIQNTLQELQRRFPDLNITEDDLKNAEKELEDFIKEEDGKKEKTGTDADEKESEIVDDTDKVESETVENKQGSEKEGEKEIENSHTAENIEKTAEDKVPEEDKPPQVENKKNI